MGWLITFMGIPSDGIWHKDRKTIDGLRQAPSTLEKPNIEPGFCEDGSPEPTSKRIRKPSVRTALQSRPTKRSSDGSGEVVSKPTVAYCSLRVSCSILIKERILRRRNAPKSPHCLKFGVYPLHFLCQLQLPLSPERIDPPKIHQCAHK